MSVLDLITEDDSKLILKLVDKWYGHRETKFVPKEELALEVCNTVMNVVDNNFPYYKEIEKLTKDTLTELQNKHSKLGVDFCCFKFGEDRQEWAPMESIERSIYRLFMNIVKGEIEQGLTK